MLEVCSKPKSCQKLLRKAKNCSERQKIARGCLNREKLLQTPKVAQKLLSKIRSNLTMLHPLKTSYLLALLNASYFPASEETLVLMH